MNYRLVLAAVVTTALLTSGCSDSKPVPTDPGEKPVGAGNCVRARYRRGDDTGPTRRPLRSLMSTPAWR